MKKKNYLVPELKIVYLNQQSSILSMSNSNGEQPGQAGSDDEAPTRKGGWDDED